MAKNQNTFEKRRREVEKKQKREEKRQRRQAKKLEDAQSPGSGPVFADPPQEDDDEDQK